MSKGVLGKESLIEWPPFPPLCSPVTFPFLRLSRFPHSSACNHSAEELERSPLVGGPDSEREISCQQGASPSLPVWPRKRKGLCSKCMLRTHARKGKCEKALRRGPFERCQKHFFPLPLRCDRYWRGLACLAGIFFPRSFGLVCGYETCMFPQPNVNVHSERKGDEGRRGRK